MKIVSFNVNGIRAILKKDFTNIFNNFNADIFCLNETKFSSDDFCFTPEGYYTYFTNSKLRKGYSGVAVFTKILPLEVKYGINEDKMYDDEGRIITLKFSNFFLVCCYVPNSGEALKRLDYRMNFEDKMKEYLKKLSEVMPVIYTGDLNVAHTEIDLKNPKANLLSAGFTKEERSKMTDLLNSGFTDCYRYLYPSKIEYTWWSYRFNARMNNSGWRIDYFIVSNEIRDLVLDVIIHNEIYGSDHCPIELLINI